MTLLLDDRPHLIEFFFFIRKENKVITVPQITVNMIFFFYHMVQFIEI